jgi:hypothetical protein
MQTTIRALIGASLVVAAFGVALAKLPPAPPLTDQQKAEKAAKDKATADAEKAALTKAEDKAVANYVANEKAKGVTPKTQMSGEAASGGGKSLSAEPEKASNAHSPPKK